ncbi:thermonuclease family protein [Kaistia adipata]|uniref:thermonuclease family protein n=1 Tax=Kaistia adipata TaxID=166954 RepID=UPI00146BC67F|nr:thermonuclease family protein [Kaistia adipata]
MLACGIRARGSVARAARLPNRGIAATLAGMIRPRSRRRKPSSLIFLLLLVAGLLLIGYLDQQLREIRTSEGSRIVVRDGDSLAIDGVDFRLAGIDAPELRQDCEAADGAKWPCGEAARRALHSLVAQGDLRCSPHTNDRFGRVVATCRIDGVGDLGAAMVRDGLAVNYGGRGPGDYAAEEDAARRNKEGIWRGRFTPPSEWRAAHPR